MRVKNDSGLIELLLILPLFVLISWGSAMLAMKLHESGKLEHSAWNYSMSRAHKAKDVDAKTNASSLFQGDHPERLIVKNDPSLSIKGLEAFDAMRSELPWAFRGGLLFSTTEQKEFCRQKSLSANNIVAWLGRHGLNFQSAATTQSGFDVTTSADCNDSGSVFFKRRVTTQNPGSDFKGSWKLKQAIWWEGMCKTDFDYPFLQGMAAPELLYILTDTDIRTATSVLCLTDHATSPSGMSIPGGGDMGKLLDGVDVSKLGPEVKGITSHGGGMPSFDDITSAAGKYGKDAAMKEADAAMNQAAGKLNPASLLDGIERKMEEKALNELRNFVSEKMNSTTSAASEWLDEKEADLTQPIDNYEKESDHDFIPTL